MNLKYYLRGLGIGIVITALLMSFATRNRNDLTDEEIKERAVALGMVEQKVLSDISANQPVETQEPQVTAEPTDNQQTPTAEPEMMPTETPAAEETAVPTETPVEEATAAPTEIPSDIVEETETITIVVKSGETSWSISKALYEAGVIESASDFDAYLCQNGYDKTIRTGTFVISKSATYEEIAKKIAR